MKEFAPLRTLAEKVGSAGREDVSREKSVKLIVNPIRTPAKILNRQAAVVQGVSQAEVARGVSPAAVFPAEKIMLDREDARLLKNAFVIARKKAPKRNATHLKRRLPLPMPEDPDREAAEALKNAMRIAKPMERNVTRLSLTKLRLK